MSMSEEESEEVIQLLEEEISGAQRAHLALQWDQEDFSDVLVRLDDGEREVHCHSLLLCQSPFLREALLLHAGTRKQTLHLSDPCTDLVLQSLYTGKLKVTNRNLTKLHFVAFKLDLKCLTTQLTSLMRHFLCARNSLHIYQYCKQNNFHCLQELQMKDKAKEFALRFFGEAMLGAEELSAESFLEFLGAEQIEADEDMMLTFFELWFASAAGRETLIGLESIKTEEQDQQEKQMREGKQGRRDDDNSKNKKSKKAKKSKQKQKGTKSQEAQIQKQGQPPSGQHKTAGTGVSSDGDFLSLAFSLLRFPCVSKKRLLKLKRESQKPASIYARWSGFREAYIEALEWQFFSDCKDEEKDEEEDEEEDEEVDKREKEGIIALDIRFRKRRLFLGGGASSEEEFSE